MGDHPFTTADYLLVELWPRQIPVYGLCVLNADVLNAVAANICSKIVHAFSP